MAEQTKGKAKAVGIVAAIVAVGAAFGLDFDDAQVEATKDAAAGAVAAGGVLVAFGRDLWAKVQSKFGG